MFPWQHPLFQAHRTFTVILEISSPQKTNPGQLLYLNAFICLLDMENEALLKNIKMELQKMSEKALTLERAGTQYVAMVT